MAPRATTDVVPWWIIITVPQKVHRDEKALCNCRFFFSPSKASVWLGLPKAVKFINSLFLEPK